MTDESPREQMKERALEYFDRRFPPGSIWHTYDVADFAAEEVERARRGDFTKSICGCVMCEFHVSAKELEPQVKP